MKHLFFIIAAFLLSCSAPQEDQASQNADTTSRPPRSPAPETFESLRGKVMREFTLETEVFKDYNDVGGSLLLPLHGIDFGIHMLRKEDDYVLIFNRIIMKGSRSYFEVLDVLEVKNVSPTRSISFAECRKDTLFDNELIALMEHEGEEEAEYYSNPVKAWRADRIKRRIVETGIDGINCYNQGYGANCGED